MTQHSTGEEQAYIAVRPCGCATGVTIINDSHSKDIAQDVKRFIESGRTIEKVSVEEAKKRLNFSCTCDEPDAA